MTELTVYSLESDTVTYTKYASTADRYCEQEGVIQEYIHTVLPCDIFRERSYHCDLRLVSIDSSITQDVVYKSLNCVIVC